MVEQDDADVRAKSVPVKHNQTQIFELCSLCMALVIDKRAMPISTNCQFHESLPISHLHPQRSSGRRRSGQPQAHDTGWHDQKLGAGIYNYMPMGLRVIRKVEAIVREEMNRAGAIETTMPVVQPAELWQETGRFEKMGPELLRIQDRHGRDFVIQPTSEEVVTDIARQEFKSYKQLPRISARSRPSPRRAPSPLWL
ncbi:hypothetical protein J4714_13365, partial [Staphylococcus epidermidis]|nr:hypothetical protein [Staphylococcus epidermidis]